MNKTITNQYQLTLAQIQNQESSPSNPQVILTAQPGRAKESELPVNTIAIPSFDRQVTEENRVKLSLALEREPTVDEIVQIPLDVSCLETEIVPDNSLLDSEELDSEAISACLEAIDRRISRINDLTESLHENLIESNQLTAAHKLMLGIDEDEEMSVDDLLNSSMAKHKELLASLKKQEDEKNISLDKIQELESKVSMLSIQTAAYRAQEIKHKEDALQLLALQNKVKALEQKAIITPATLAAATALLLALVGNIISSRELTIVAVFFICNKLLSLILKNRI